MSDRNRAPNKASKRWTLLVRALVFGLLLTACGGRAGPETYTIGVINLAPTLEDAMLADILAVANAHQLATSVPTVDRVADGVLYSYAMKQGPTGQQAARMADQILEGIKPADLPVETTEFFLALNLKTAQVIGVTVPDDILSQAETIYC